jgi:hypothetical protein
VRDPPVAEGDQMLDPELHATRVVDGHARAEAADATIDEDEGEAFARQLCEGRLRRRRARDEQPVHAPLAQEALEGLPRLEELLAVGEQHHVARGRRAPLRAADDLGVHGVGEVRNDHPERRRPRELEASREGVRAVVELPRRSENPLSRLRPDRDRRVAVQHPRRDRGADAGRVRDVDEPNGFPRRRHARARLEPL